MKSTEVDFNTVIHGQLNSIIEAQAISSELKMYDNGYMLTITIEKMEEE
jgi:hypothetical protein